MECEIHNINVIESLENIRYNLTILHLQCYFIVNLDKIDSALSQLFIKTKRIKILMLDNFKKLTGECFLFLNKDTIEEISLIENKNIERNYLAKSLLCFEKLHKLELIKVSCNSFEDVAEYVGLCTNLKELNISAITKSNSNWFVKYSDENLIREIPSKNLEKLTNAYLKQDTIKPSFFSYINSNLHKINLTGCSWITDYELASFSSLTNLKILEICGCENLSGWILVKFPSLKELNCRKCNKLENNHLINFLRCANNLELLDIIGCFQITNSVINIAIEVTKIRRKSFTRNSHF